MRHVSCSQEGVERFGTPPGVGSPSRTLLVSVKKPRSSSIVASSFWLKLAEGALSREGLNERDPVAHVPCESSNDSGNTIGWANGNFSIDIRAGTHRGRIIFSTGGDFTR